MPTYSYAGYCAACGSNVTTAGMEPPAVCPLDVHHALDPASVVRLARVIDESAVTTVRVQEEYMPTQGNFRTQAFRLEIAATAAPQTFDFNVPFDVCVTSIKFSSAEAHRGDCVDSYIVVAPPIGYLTQGADAGATTLHVSNTVLNAADPGYVLLLAGAGGQELGEVRGMDKLGGTVDVEHALAAPAPAYTPLQMMIHPVKDYWIEEPTQHTLGSSLSGGSSKPAATTFFRVVYRNGTGLAKRLVFCLEFTY